MDLPDLPEGYVFHVGRKHALRDERYDSEYNTYGVQIRQIGWLGLRFRIVYATACDPNPIMIREAAALIAGNLHQRLWRESQEEALSGKYDPKKHVLPEPENWTKAIEATRPKPDQRAIGRR